MTSRPRQRSGRSAKVPRDGLSEWREVVRRHLRPSQGMTLVDIGVQETATEVLVRAGWLQQRYLPIVRRYILLI